MNIGSGSPVQEPGQVPELPVGGLTLQPTNINIQVHPGYEHVITLTPTDVGDFGIVCNEYCGIGHHTMTGRIRVIE